MINGQILKQAVISGANNISNQKNSINDLNIFPVPDEPSILDFIKGWCLCFKAWALFKEKTLSVEPLTFSFDFWVLQWYFTRTKPTFILCRLVAVTLFIIIWFCKTHYKNRQLIRLEPNSFLLYLSVFGENREGIWFRVFGRQRSWLLNRWFPAQSERWTQTARNQSRQRSHWFPFPA